MEFQLLPTVTAKAVIILFRVQDDISIVLNKTLIAAMELVVCINI